MFIPAEQMRTGKTNSVPEEQFSFFLQGIETGAKFIKILSSRGAWGSVVVKALCYKLVGPER